MNIESETQRGTDNKLVERGEQNLKSDALTVSETQASSPNDPSLVSGDNENALGSQPNKAHITAETAGKVHLSFRC